MISDLSLEAVQQIVEEPAMLTRQVVSSHSRYFEINHGDVLSNSVGRLFLSACGI